LIKNTLLLLSFLIQIVTLVLAILSVSIIIAVSAMPTLSLNARGYKLPRIDYREGLLGVE